MEKLSCPFGGECKERKCAMFFGGMCAMTAIADSLFHIKIDTETIASHFEEDLETIVTVCPFEPNKERDCFECSCYDEDNECCKFVGQKKLLNDLYEDAFTGLFKDSATKEE